MAVRSKVDAASLRSLARKMYFSNESIDALLSTASAELGIRARNKRERLYRRASFPGPKSVEGYDFSQVTFPDGYGPADLMSLSFVERAEDFVFLGPTGRGKTHLAIAVGTACVNAGIGPDTPAAEACELVMAQLLEMEYAGLTGVMTWNEDGTVSKTPKAVIIQNGVYVSAD